MIRSEFCAHVADRAFASRATADASVSAIGKTLPNGNIVAIAGFGTFTARARPARQGRNPATGETIAIPASNTPAFEAGKKLRDVVNGRTLAAAQSPLRMNPRAAGSLVPAPPPARTDTPMAPSYESPSRN